MELEFIRWLRERLPAHANLVLGPGDDAAILRMTADRDVVVTSDLLTDGVDFVLSECDPRRIGRKALAVNLSDLAAMASQPIAAVISVALPHRDAGQLARQLFAGILDLAAEFDVAVAGGDTNTWDGGLVISVTALGQVTPRGPLRRNGARPGDQILVTGSFGGSILGKHFDFRPRVREALLLCERYTLHAGIDVSDGLSLDLSRLIAESGCGAAVSLEHVPIDACAYQLAAMDKRGLTPLQHAMGDGEDFELILSVPSDDADRIVRDQPLDVPMTRIGRMIDAPGLWQIQPDGSRLPLTASGYEHR